MIRPDDHDYTADFQVLNAVSDMLSKTPTERLQIMLDEAIVANEQQLAKK